LLTACQVGRSQLRAYSHRFSPQKFTQPQLFACLVLKEFLQLDYRKLAALLADTPSLAAAIKLDVIPHYTTFPKAAQRLLVATRARRLLDETVDRAAQAKLMKRRVKLAAIDGTGFERWHVSTYYAKRCEKTVKNQERKRRRFPKAGIACDCASHFILAVIPGVGPGPDDKHYRPALKQTAGSVSVETLLADAGYDGEPAHEHARQTYGMRTIIPPTRGRPTDKLPTGRWRRRMATHFNQLKYGQRWQIETVNSMLKRLLGSALRARKHWTKHREITQRAITHNLMILRMKVFYRAKLADFHVGTLTFLHYYKFCVSLGGISARFARNSWIIIVLRARAGAGTNRWQSPSQGRELCSGIDQTGLGCGILSLGASVGRL